MNGCIYRTEFDVCKKYTTDKATSFCVGRNCLDRKPSNSDRIRSMTDEELANWLGVYCNGKTAQEVGKPCVSDMGSCEECWLEWLKQESEDDW